MKRRTVEIIDYELGDLIDISGVDRIDGNKACVIQPRYYRNGKRELYVITNKCEKAILTDYEIDACTYIGLSEEMKGFFAEENE